MKQGFYIVIIIALLGVIIALLVEKERMRNEIINDEKIVAISIDMNIRDWKRDAILETAVLEILARWWNTDKSQRHWIEKYIKALASDKKFKINRNSDIIIDIE